MDINIGEIVKHLSAKNDLVITDGGFRYIVIVDESPRLAALLGLQLKEEEVYAFIEGFVPKTEDSLVYEIKNSLIVPGMLEECIRELSKAVLKATARKYSLSQLQIDSDAKFERYGMRILTSQNIEEVYQAGNEYSGIIFNEIICEAHKKCQEGWIKCEEEIRPMLEN